MVDVNQIFPNPLPLTHDGTFVSSLFYAQASPLYNGEVY